MDQIIHLSFNVSGILTSKELLSLASSNVSVISAAQIPRLFSESGLLSDSLDLRKKG
jgi:hypothetical protein